MNQHPIQLSTALRTTEERLHLALEAMNGGVWDWNVRTGEVYLSPSWSKMLGYRPGELPGRIETWEHALHPDDKVACMKRLEDHVEQRTSVYQSEHRMRTRSGEWIWVLDRGRMIERGPAGEPLRMMGTDIDISDRKRWEESLRRSEQRFDLAARGSSDGLWDWPDVHREEEWWSPRYYELLGYEDGEIAPRHSRFLDLVHPDDRRRTREAILRHFDHRAPYDVEYRLRTKSGVYRWFRGRGQALWDESGKSVRMAGSILDITDHRDAVDRQRRLLQELDHRVKNNLSSVLALVDATAAATESTDDFRTAFRDRVMAMARTHEALARESWHGVAIAEAVQIALAPHVEIERRVTLDGSELVLPSRVTPPLGLALHELATNAAKHALSTADGTIEIKWSAGADDRVELSWLERGGPPVVDPTRPSGLGLPLVKGLIEHEIGGTFESAFDARGFTCTITLPGGDSKSRNACRPKPPSSA